MRRLLHIFKYTLLLCITIPLIFLVEDETFKYMMYVVSACSIAMQTLAIIFPDPTAHPGQFHTTFSIREKQVLSDEQKHKIKLLKLATSEYNHLKRNKNFSKKNVDKLLDKHFHHIKHEGDDYTHGKL